MGTTIYNGYNKKDVIAMIKKETDVMRSCVRGNSVWSLHRLSDGRVIIGLYLLKTDDAGNWGYKFLDESSHPYYYSCPLLYLDDADIFCQRMALFLICLF